MDYKELIAKLRATKSVSKRQMLDAAADTIEQLLADLRGKCSCCVNYGSFLRCLESEDWIVEECEDCDQDCQCKSCEKGSKWEWRGIPESKVVEIDQVTEGQ